MKKNLARIESALTNTRKSLLEVCGEFGIKYDSEVEIRLKQCNSCGIWLKNMRLDLDGLDICNYCYEHYGP